MEANLQLVIWVHPEYDDEFHHVIQRLSWTRAEVSEISHLAPNILSWSVRIPLDESVLIRIGKSIKNFPSDSWAIAFVEETGTWLRKNLAQLCGQIVVDERPAAALRIHVHCDHPMHRELRRQHLGLWIRREFPEPNAEDDPGEALRKIRNVPRSRDYELESQSVEVRLPLGKSPGRLGVPCGFS